MRLAWLSESADERQHRAYGSVATFEGARSVCVASDGDLPTDGVNYTHEYALELFSEFSLR